jgi:hypothetical protein
LPPAFLLLVATLLLTANAHAESKRINLGWMDIIDCTKFSWDGGLERARQTMNAYVDVDAPNASEIQSDLKECALEGAGAAGVTAIVASPEAAMPAFEATFGACVSAKAEEYSSISLGVDSSCHWDGDDDSGSDDPGFVTADEVSYDSDNMNTTWSVPNKAYGKINIAASSSGRNISVSCNAQASGHHRNPSWIQMQIVSSVRGIEFTSEQRGIDNASAVNSGTLSGYIPAGTSADITVAAPNKNADADFLNCTISLSN